MKQLQTAFIFLVFSVILLVLTISTLKSEVLSYNIHIMDVVDGDTLRAQFDGLSPPLNRVSIRVLGIDTPEIHGKCTQEKALAGRAKAFLKMKLIDAHTVTIKDVRWDKYGGRILANVYFDDENISQMLIDNGMAIPYFGGKKTKDWCATTINLDQ